MKKFVSIAAVAALGMLAACNQTPAENAADQVRENAENTADAMEDQADTMNNAMAEDTMEDRADAVREQAENTADAMESTNTTDPMVANQADTKAK